MDTGKATTTGTTIRVSQLIPGTTYTFRVSAVTQKGRGAEVSQVSRTERAQFDNGNATINDGTNPATISMYIFNLV